MKKPANFSVMVLLTLAMGCSAFRSSHQTLTVQVTDPPHAKVWVNRVCEGEAPVQVSGLRNKEVDVTVEKEGFHTENRTVRYHLNTTGYPETRQTVPAVAAVGRCGKQAKSC